MAPYTLRESLAAFRRAPMLTGLSAAMVGLALFVVGLFAIAAYNLRLALASVEERVEIVAYVQDGTSPEEIEEGRRQIEILDPVREVRFVSKEEALLVARTELPEIRELSSDLDVNPFPASFEIRLAEESRSAESVAEVADDVAVLPFVDDVRYGREWVEQLFLIQRIGAVASAVIGTAFAVVAALIIGTAIRIAIFARGDEIRIMQLVGAKDSFIRRPFVLEGAFTGLLGGLLAVGLTALSHWTVDRYLLDIEWIPAEWLALGLTVGVVYGAFASGLAVRRHLGDV